MWCKRFSRSEDGVSLVFVTVALPALVGFALLAVDASRVYNLHYDLQKGADAFALAAAAELDRSGDACERAERAIANLLANRHSLSDLGIHTLVPGDVTPHYLDALPPDDDDPIDAAYLAAHEIPNCDEDTPAADQRRARFVEVVINPTQITSIFPATFLGAASDSLQMSASAVAGYGQNVCKFTPLYVCNPWEETGISLEDAANDRTERRKLIELRPSGGTNDFPGSFGYLEAPGGPGAAELRDSIGRVNPGACFAQDDGVEIQTGAVIGPVREAINTRFDIYEGSYNSKKSDPNFRPARNVRKGYASSTPPVSACNPDNDPGPGFMGLPRDNCFLTDPATCGRDVTDPPS
ncbi:MAG TPA: pilus assembly protein TadG-related protein, partial [Propylenella sp.]